MPRVSAGWTLLEMMIAVALFTVAGLAIGSMYIFSARSMVAMSNYGVLDKANRQALDLLTREVRQARKIVSYQASPPVLSLQDGDGNTIVYSFSTSGKQMVRDSSDGAHQVLLDNCDLLQFDLYKRNPVNASYGLLPVATKDVKYTAKVLVITWKTAMKVHSTSRTTSEQVQTARIVIRKAQTTD